ncbi:hypothetical protein FHS18_004643 [Paenibacillus phyllosphaerae]|uniref:Uncharacterized protein n=1 Tax=Paenibacillus phyllosphaerae TaxID=274593 RepID=A0A7W5FPT5_9BACL|nr:choice-of-anchor I family protein [Paenibacillus phyllosphaerae]MBB3112542.1 hypothetical protein [Paenibacillus phyllosphaerae]
MNKRNRQKLAGVLAAGMMVNAALAGGQSVWAEDTAIPVVKVGTPYKADGTYDVSVPHVIINQVYGGGTKDADDTYISNGFIELYNPTDSDIVLDGWSVQYAYSSTPKTGVSGDWSKLSLTGTIKAKSFFLIAAKPTGASAENKKVDISDPNYYDQGWLTTYINNKALKVVLMSNDVLLAAENKNPFAGKTAGYVDMLGTAGNDEGSKIDGYEGTTELDYPTGDAEGNSKKKALRRVNFIDTDNNRTDFDVVNYSTATNLDEVRPRSGKELKLAITTKTLLEAYAGIAYTATISVEGGTAPYHYSATGLPDGLTLNADTGVLSGTPTVEGSSDIAITVTDSAATAATSNVSLSLKVNAAPEAPIEDQITMTKIGSYDVGTTNAKGGVAEIVKYNADNGKFYLVNGSGNPPSLEIVKLNANGTLTHEKQIKVQDLAETNGFAYGDLTSVDVNTTTDRISVSVQEAAPNKPGKILVLDYDGNLLQTYEAGIQPDMIKSTPDGRYILTADEGEPRTSAIDPEGSVTVVDTTKKTVSHVKFTNPAIIDDNVHIRGKDGDGQITTSGTKADAVFDLEPEYITLSADGKQAYVSLQENNAIAVLDIAGKSFTAVKSLGFKDLSDPKNALDLDKNGKINPENVPFKSMYMPDGIASYTLDGQTYVLTANEGDVTEWADREGDAADRKNGADLKDVRDNLAEGSAAAEFLALPENATRFDKVEVATDMGNDTIYMFGGRSFSIWNATTMEQVFDSGNDFETITAQRLPAYFNAGNDDAELDSRSRKKGPEPEDVKVGKVGSRTFAFTGLERIGGIMTYDITNPANPVFMNYTNTRDFNADLDTDSAPEGLEFIPAADSPTGRPLLLVAYEVGGKVSLMELNVTKVTLDHKTVALKTGSKTAQLTATVEPMEEGGSTNVTWSSSNTSVATVDEQGKVTSVAAGTAIITALSADGYGSGQAVVTVTAADTGANFPGDLTGGSTGGTTTPTEGNGSGNGTTTTDGVTTAAVSVPAVTGTDGKATAAVGKETITEALGQLAQAGGTSKALELKATAPADAKQVSFTVAGDAFSQIASSGVQHVTLNAGLAELTLDAATLAAVGNAGANGDVSVSVAVAQLGEGALNHRPVYDFTITAGGKAVTAFGGGAVSIAVPYAPAAGEDPNAIVIYYVKDNGELEVVTNGRYDAATGAVSFSVAHFSRYAVGYNKLSFSDSANSFASSAITYLSARGVITGVDATHFAPGDHVTRADFVVLLSRLAGETLGTSETAFADVSPQAYYSGAVAWAVQQGIVSGIGDGVFDPLASITREQMVTMIVRFAEATGYELPKTTVAIAFADASSIASFGRKAVEAVQMAGIISGKPAAGGGVNFAPKDTATRAEAAMVLAALLQGMSE